MARWPPRTSRSRPSTSSRRGRLPDRRAGSRPRLVLDQLAPIRATGYHRDHDLRVPGLAAGQVRPRAAPPAAPGCPRRTSSATSGPSTRSSPRRPLGHPAGRQLPAPAYDGVLGVWYGKAPGPRPRRRLPSATATSSASRVPAGGSRSSATTRPASRRRSRAPRSQMLAGLHVPTLYPGRSRRSWRSACTPYACSRASGLWAAFKSVTNIADGAGGSARAGGSAHGSVAARRAVGPPGEIAGGPGRPAA